MKYFEIEFLLTREKCAQNPALDLVAELKPQSHWVTTAGGQQVSKMSPNIIYLLLLEF